MENSPLELITYFYTAFNIQTNMDEDKLPKEFPDEPTVDVDWNVSLAGEGNKFFRLCL